MILLCLHRILPDTVINTYKKIEVLKDLRLKDCNLEFNLLINLINEKRDEIMDIDSNAYLQTQYAADLFRITSEGTPEAMNKWVDSKHMQWATGETPFDPFVLQQCTTKVYTNITSSG